LTAHKSPFHDEKLPETTGASTNTSFLFRQLALQSAAVIAVLSLAWPYFGLRNEPLPWPETALAIGFTAFLFAHTSKQRFIWQFIHAAFLPLLWLIY
jgi:hypothetical protein